MAVFSLREAAEQAGTSKSTIWRAVKSGRLSAARTDENGFAIDAAELFRVFPPQRPAPYAEGQDAMAAETPMQRIGTDETAIRLAALDAEIRGLRELLAEVKTSRDELRADREGLRAERDEWKGRADRLLTDQRPSWWRRLVG